jgi:glycine/D-amino acid oxidase-like deaminating enzyme
MSASFWLDAPGGPRPSLPGDVEADVAIVGAGFTGLWTACHLALLDSRLRIVVLEREVVGHGASGRNGGWCSALFPRSWSAVARQCGEGAARAMRGALAEAVEDVGRFCERHAVDAQYARGGTLTLARSPAQATRLRARVADLRAWGGDARWLSAAEATARVAAAGVLSAAWSAECAAVHPGRLVRGLAEVAGRLGVTIYERTPVARVGPGLAETPLGRVRARFVVRATEAYTGGRTLAPLYSHVVATAPLPEAVWDGIGWRDRETLADGRHRFVYAQRTADGRIVIGGRGARYHYGSGVRPEHDRSGAAHDALRAALGDLFPQLADVEITHRWGGPFAVARDWWPSVALDRATGLAQAGGYAGDGVACAALAGRTLAELICGLETERTRLPWVDRRPRRWEPEPLRWLGIQAGLAVRALADWQEDRTGRPFRLPAAFDSILRS